MGEGYRYAIVAEKSARGEDDPTSGDETIEELDDHAARTRLECYRYFGADIPPGGREPTLTPKVKKTRELKKAKARAEAPPKVCAVHNLVLPVSGVCCECG